MNKTGWQAAALFASSVAVLMTATAWNTGRALDVANDELRNPPVAATSSADDTPCQYSKPAITERPATVPDATARCIGNELFRKIGNEWRQLNATC